MGAASGRVGRAGEPERGGAVAAGAARASGRAELAGWREHELAGWRVAAARGWQPAGEGVGVRLRPGRQQRRLGGERLPPGAKVEPPEGSDGRQRLCG
jgi:hypothetical protein